MNDIPMLKPKKIKPIKVRSYKDFFVSLARLVLNAVTLRPEGVTEAGIDALASLGVEETAGELAWTLVNSAMGKAIHTLVKENTGIFNITDGESFIAQAETLTKDGEFSIDADFFRQPGQSDFMRHMQEILRKWLEFGHVPTEKAATIVHRLPSFFVYELNDEWQRHPEKYSQLISLYDTPFFKASEREHEWERYAAWLNKQVNESVFGEFFSLRQIYVPLCAYYEEKESEQEKKREARENARRVVVELEQHLEAWLAAQNRSDAIRVLSGGPGSGKSSFAKMFAAKQAASRKVLFIPLHLIDTKAKLPDAIGDYLRSSRFFADNPYDTERELLIIFDGLDELAQQGKACAEVARSFAEEVRRQVEISNGQSLVRVLITGRNLAVQSSESIFRDKKQILHLLPYSVPNDDKEEYADEQRLLHQDRRDIWWKQYGGLTGKNYSAMPDTLRGKRLDELTAQPLLNYLVALSYERGKVDFSKDANLNTVYADLFNAVYERGYAGGQHVGTGGMTEGQFLRVMEEIAVSAWHGAGRTTTVAAIAKRCAENNLSRLLDRFQLGAEAGVVNLLTAFYFRQSGGRQDGDKTFEFTHKSFGEYLIAQRLIHQLGVMEKQWKNYREGTGDEGWTERECLRRWALLCGPTALDDDIFRFLGDEARLRGTAAASQWQNMLCRLIEHLLRHGMPFERIALELTFLQKCRQSRNAEEALLAALCACARVTAEVSDIDWGEETAFANWFLKLQGQRDGASFTCKCLSYLNIQNCNLRMMDFLGASLMGANLQGANLQRANLSRANLLRADLLRASLQGANLREADLEGADLREADWQGADLRGARLKEANLERVKGIPKRRDTTHRRTPCMS